MEKKHSRNAIIFLLMNVMQGINAQIDYCKENSNHLLCNIDCGSYIREKGGSECKDYLEVQVKDEETMKFTVVNVHNSVRRNITYGSNEMANRDIFPKPKDMKYLKWDDLLYCSAKVKADQCTTKETEPELRTINGYAIGEVTYKRNKISLYAEIAHLWKLIIKEIFRSERINFELNYIKQFNCTGLNGNSIANLGQIISSKIHLVGCAASSPDKSSNEDGSRDIIFVCHYGPEGLMEGTSVYEEKKDKLCENEEPQEGILCKSGENYALDLYPKKSTTTSPPPGSYSTPKNKEPGGNYTEELYPMESTTTSLPSESYSAPKNKGTGFLFIGVLLKAFFAI